MMGLHGVPPPGTPNTAAGMGRVHGPLIPGRHRRDSRHGIPRPFPGASLVITLVIASDTAARECQFCIESPPCWHFSSRRLTRQPAPPQSAHRVPGRRRDVRRPAGTCFGVQPKRAGAPGGDVRRHLGAPGPARGRSVGAGGRADEPGSGSPYRLPRRRPPAARRPPRRRAGRRGGRCRRARSRPRPAPPGAWASGHPGAAGCHGRDPRVGELLPALGPPAGVQLPLHRLRRLDLGAEETLGPALGQAELPGLAAQGGDDLGLARRSSMGAPLFPLAARHVRADGEARRMRATSSPLRDAARRPPRDGQPALQRGGDAAGIGSRAARGPPPPGRPRPLGNSQAFSTTSKGPLDGSHRGPGAAAAAAAPRWRP